MSIKKIGNINPMRDQRAIARAVERELTDIGLDLERSALEYLSRHKIDDQGDLAKSIRSNVEKLVDMWRIQFGSGARHGIFVHEGTKPHWIGKDTDAGKAIRAWTRRKLNLRGSSLERATFFIRRKISKEGTKARPFLTVAIRVHRPKIRARIQQAIDREIARAS